MDFGTRHLLRHRKVYRSMDLPFGIARLWSNIEKVSFEYVEGRDEVVIRPVRSMPKTQKVGDQVQAKAQMKKDPKPAKEEIHTPQAHFSL
jgi:hypothetical protein